MNEPENRRETGGRTLKPDTRPPAAESKAAENKPPRDGQGLSSPADETLDETHQADGANQKV